MTIKPKTIEELSKLPLAMAAEYHDPKEHDLTKEDPYVRDLRHGFVNGIKHTLFEQNFYKEHNSFDQASYDQGYDQGYADGEHDADSSYLQDKIDELEAEITRLEAKLKTAQKQSFDEGYEKALEEQSVW